MEREILIVDCNSSVSELEEMMSTRRKCTAILIKRNGEPKGVISTKDLTNIRSKGMNPVATKAWEICSVNPLSIEIDATIKEAASIIAKNNINRLIVSCDGTLAGIITTFNITQAVAAA